MTSLETDDLIVDLRNTGFKHIEPWTWIYDGFLSPEVRYIRIEMLEKDVFEVNFNDDDIYIMETHHIRKGLKYFNG